MSEKRLEFGYNRGLPATADTAWGARAILSRNGYVDILWDRQGRFGAEKDIARLVARLNGKAQGKGLLARAKKRVASLVKAGDMSPSDDHEFVLFEDATVKIVGNPMRSYGYLYIAAFYKQPLGTPALPA